MNTCDRCGKEKFGKLHFIYIDKNYSICGACHDEYEAVTTKAAKKWFEEKKSK